MIDMSRRNSLSALAPLPAASGTLPSVPRWLRPPTAGDPLPSWNDGATKKSITDFVSRVTKSRGR